MTGSATLTPPQLWLLLGCLSATLYMTGVIWVVQLVHYALFDRVGVDGWTAYHAAHSRQTTAVVLGPMAVQLGTACLLALHPPAAFHNGPGRLLLFLGAVFAVLTWAVTFFVSVPLHGELGRGFDAKTCRALVQTNWWRTVLWTGHAFVLLEALRRLLVPLTKVG